MNENCEDGGFDTNLCLVPSVHYMHDANMHLLAIIRIADSRTAAISKESELSFWAQLQDSCCCQTSLWLAADHHYSVITASSIQVGVTNNFGHEGQSPLRLTRVRLRGSHR